MNAQDIREAFLEYFAGRGHKVVRSSPLLPKDDPTLLFANAGMNQFKNVFLGMEKRSYSRAASVQKCMRVSGKHNDLDQVGRTTKHHTFFEMLGNFSFGDYFKKEAVAFAWELMTEVFRLPKDRLYATVYEDDDDAYRLWREEIGLSSDRVFHFGKKDNFWAMGDTGPCGPCSELHYDFDPTLEDGAPRDLIEKGSDRYVELWNLVFMQFEQDGMGSMKPLPRPSIDTGMGLERLTAVLQGKTSNWDTDLFFPLIGDVGRRTGRDLSAGGEDAVSARIIADHSRSIAFLIADGIMPANDGRGYVLRRLIRRAFRQGQKLGLDRPFVHEMLGPVAEIMKDAYPELTSSLPLLTRICRAEEERFSRTLSSGFRYFQDFARSAGEGGSRRLSGEAAFKLYDTFGFPLDLTRELAQEEGITVDETAFSRELERQKSRARQSWKGDTRSKEKKAYEGISPAEARYAGSDAEDVAETRVLAVIKDGIREPELREGEKGDVVLALTPFYAEAGGQVGDAGLIKAARASVVVENTHYPVPDLRSHQVRVLSGTLKEGDIVQASIDAARRRATEANHTATHLLHASLRSVLGEHVKQAGSLVGPLRLRFDFTHYQALSEEETAAVEAIVNEKIRQDIPLAVAEMSLEEGLRSGAMAIFEEKYGERVRMVTVGDYSRELCGGAHVRTTGEIGFFKVVAESSVAAGMRRIEALTGEEALKHVQETERLVHQAAAALSVSRKDLLAQIKKIQEQVREKEHELKTLRRTKVQSETAAAQDRVETVKSVTVLVRRADGLNPTDARTAMDDIKKKIKSGLAVLGTVHEGKALLVVGVTKDMSSRVSAGNVIKRLAPIIGGGGGGRPDFAQAGGPDIAALDKALAESLRIIEQLLP
ncbi:MAG: alanine--tRNA ligase [Candidatus Aminicenantes bacterium]|nr:alanine--tRNA ligase [Candidatus Aminicenantes bacterium]